MIPIVVLASGRGSNFEAIYSAVARGDLKAEIRAVISDRPEAVVLEKAKSVGLQSICVPFPKAEFGLDGGARRRLHEKLLLAELEKFRPRFLVLAGYMRLMTAELIDFFRNKNGISRMVNVHPALLPAFKGLNAYQQAFDYGSKVAGVTVHLVEAEMDSGPICAQQSFSIEDCRSVEEVEQRGLQVEHDLFPKTLSWVLPENFELERRSGGRIYVRPN